MNSLKISHEKGVIMNLQTPRGTRDFMPGEMEARKGVFATVERVYERCGFRPLETPAFEEMEVLTAKCGEDVVKQIYRIGDSSYGLRFDLTVPMARVVASNSSLPKPFKRYQIGPVWRRDEPQKGRFREFWQADVDIVGSGEMAADAEVLAAACDALSELGFSGFEVRVNNRKLLDAVVEKAGVEKTKAGAVFRALDKIEKIGEEAVREELKAKARVGEKEIAKLMEVTKISGSSQKKLSEAAGMVSGNARGEEGLKELTELIYLFGKYEVAKKCSTVVDFALVRGLDYYTGPIFEVKIPEGGVGSVAGGGRYDELIQLYGAPPTPATGISLGIERIIEVMRARKADDGKRRLVFVAAVKPEFREYAMKVVEEFRKAGVPAETDLMGRNLRKQMEYANSIGAGFAAVVGEKEQKAATVTLRDLASGKEETVAVSDAAAKLKG